MRQIAGTSPESDAFSRDLKHRWFDGRVRPYAGRRHGKTITSSIVSVIARSGSDPAALGGLDPLLQHSCDVQREAKRSFRRIAADLVRIVARKTSSIRCKLLYFVIAVG